MIELAWGNLGLIVVFSYLFGVLIGYLSNYRRKSDW